jgi:aminobenzoyl-glutamate utilization protein A
MSRNFSQMVEEIYPSMVEWRRDFHKYAESGWVEFRTASIVASKLSEWGYQVKVGKEVVDHNSRMGVPPQSVLEMHEKRALEQGAKEEWLPYLSGGYTGVVGVLDTGKPGPTVGLRFDMDALDIQESNAEDHFPVSQEFQSINSGMMHSCGHDAHTSIGLGLAKLLKGMKEELTGKIKLIFQPAEEGVRGAKSMVEAGVVDDVDLFIAAHVGTGVPLGEVICGSNGFLSTTKLNVEFSGKAAHAGAKPEEGKNALLAAASAVLGLQSIPRHSGGASRVNVGVLQAGSGRNIIPQHAHLKVETRGINTEVNEFMLESAKSVLNGAASMYGVDVEYDIVGEARTSDSSEELIEFMHDSIGNVTGVHSIVKSSSFAAGSEDATYMMARVKENGGLATYSILGTTLAAGHHNEKFDIDETVMKIGVESFLHILTSVKNRQWG